MRVYDLDLSVDTLKALLWQYNDAERLKSLVFQKQAWHDQHQQEFWRDWIRDVFDIRTANDFGLTVWSIILGCKSSVTIEGTNKANFGFGSSNLNFNNGNFGQAGSRSRYLTTAQKRTLLRLRYFNLIARGTVPETNRMLHDVFGEVGRVYVLDSNDMGYMTYVFLFNPSDDTRFLLDNLDILPRPATVGARYLVVTRPVFGFGSFNINFNNATFKGQ